MITKINFEIAAPIAGSRVFKNTQLILYKILSKRPGNYVQ